MIIASWNILCDIALPSHAPQKERLDELVAEIMKLKEKSDRIAVFLCEVQDAENCEYIARKSGLVVVGEPCRYRTRYEHYMAYICDAETAKTAVVERFMIDETNHKEDAVLELRIAEQKIIGLHLPYQVFAEYGLRKKFMQRVLSRNPTMFMGDFNATPFFPLRMKLSRTEYSEVHRAKRPKFPSPSYRGKNIHWWLPTISIDVQYFLQNQMQISDSGYVLSEASDHPLIWSKIKL